MALLEGPQGRCPTVCLIEDHAALREQLVQLLHSHQIDVVASVGTYREGCRAVNELRPDIAVIDNRLPDGRGIDLCRKLHRALPDLRILVHTGTLTDEDAQEALDAGASAIVTKSIRGTDLLEAIRTHAPA